MRVTGPVGRLEVAGYKQDQIVLFKKWIDPVGTLEFPVTSGDALPIDANGGIFLRVSGGDPDRPELTKTESGQVEKANYWRIESFEFEFKAKTTDDVK